MGSRFKSLSEEVAAKYPYRVAQREIMHPLTTPTLADTKWVDTRDPMQPRPTIPTGQAYKDRRGRVYELLSNGSVRRVKPGHTPS